MAKYSNVIAGLQLFASKRDPGAHMGGADHDIIFGAHSSDVELTEEEVEQLKEWGWFLSKEYDCWCHFV